MWQFDTSINLGNVITLVGCVGTIWSLHRQNITRIEHAAGELAEIRTKVNAMWESWRRD